MNKWDKTIETFNLKSFSMLLNVYDIRKYIWKTHFNANTAYE